MTTDNEKSSNFLNTYRKAEITDALSPLSDDFLWLKDVLINLEEFGISNDFELIGFTRKITYELLEEDPKLFANNDTKTAALKALTQRLYKKYNIEPTNENFAEMVKRIYNETQSQKTSNKKPTGR